MKLLKIGDLVARIPIIQGGMGVGISLSGLASAVANEGGIGVISAAGLGLIYKDRAKSVAEAAMEGLKEELRKAREMTSGIIGVNIMVAMSNFSDMVRTAIHEGADIIFSGAGLPLNLPSYLTEGAKTKLAPIVSSARAAKVLCEKWWSEYRYTPDAIVVEGPKAGGHLGYKANQINDEQYSLETILPQVVETVRKWADEHNCEIPVIAAGGIYTGEDIYNIMELGASGVQMGTRFVTTEECDANIGFKQAYIDAKDKQAQDHIRMIVMTSVTAFLLLLATVFAAMLQAKVRRNSLRVEEKNLELARSNASIAQTEEILRRTNMELVEANAAKEEYLGLFLSMCSGYLDKLKKTISREQYDAELKTFYKTFDTSFLQLYPTFAEDFNALLKEDCRINVKEGELLTTELRIFALIKLGITQSSHIASLLRYSVNTIYNYRAQIKNAALTDRENFEELVRNIGR